MLLSAVNRIDYKPKFMGNNKEINLRTIAESWRMIVVFVVVFAALAFFVSTVVTPRYGSETQVLILQKNINADAYQASKSSEFAGSVLVQVIGSSDFMNGVLQRVGENSAKYGDTAEEQMKNWNKAVDASASGNAGVLKLEISDTSKAEDRKMTEAVIGELIDNGVKYHGNENITLKKIGGPVYFDNPVFPVIWLNVLIAAVAGLFFSIGLVFVLGERTAEWFVAGRSHQRYIEPVSGFASGTFEYKRENI